VQDEYISNHFLKNKTKKQHSNNNYHSTTLAVRKLTCFQHFQIFSHMACYRHCCWCD